MRAARGAISMLSEEVAFNAVLREAIVRIGAGVSWLPLLRRVPLVRWPMFLAAVADVERMSRTLRRGI